MLSHRGVAPSRGLTRGLEKLVLEADDSTRGPFVRAISPYQTASFGLLGSVAVGLPWCDSAR